MVFWQWFRWLWLREMDIHDSFMLSVTKIKIWKAREIKKEKGRIKNLEGKVEEELSCVL